MNFAVIDVETANEDSGSICQVGIATFRSGELTDAWVSLVNPHCDFRLSNIAVHGIDEYCVGQAPSWDDIFPQVHARLTDTIVVSHTQYDHHALSRACARAYISEQKYPWLDSAQVVRIAWPQFSKRGYSLTNIAAHLEIPYRAHDALEDARCTGLVLLRAIEKTGIGVEGWIERTARRGKQRHHSHNAVCP